MTKEELRDRIKGLAFEVIKDKKTSEIAAVQFDELTKFPELKEIIVSLLTAEFNNLQNDEEFYLIWMGRSWIAQIEGKKYYLLNLPEEERAAQAIARLLRYGTPESEDKAGGDDAGLGDTGGGDEEVDVEVDDTTDVEVET